MSANAQTPEQAAALAAYWDNANDIKMMIHQLQDLFVDYLRDASEGLESINAEIIRDLRAQLLITMETVGLDRDEIEERLSEQREYLRSLEPAETAVDPVEPYGMCEPCEI